MIKFSAANMTAENSAMPSTWAAMDKKELKAAIKGTRKAIAMIVAMAENEVAGAGLDWVGPANAAWHAQCAEKASRAVDELVTLLAITGNAGELDRESARRAFRAWRQCLAICDRIGEKIRLAS